MRPLKFRAGSAELSLVHTRDVHEIRTRADAMRVASVLIEQLGREGVDRLLRSVESLHDGDLGAATEAVIEHLLNGTLVLVRQESEPRLLDSPRVTPLSDLVDPSEPKIERSTISLLVVHETGGLFAGARFVAETPDGRLVDGKLDDNSRWGLDDAVAGSYLLRFAEPLVLTEEEQRRPSTNATVTEVDDHTAMVSTKAHVSVPTGRHRRLVVQVPPPAPVIAFHSGSFAHGSSLPTPGVAIALDLFAAGLPGQASQRISVIGHADGGGDDLADKALSSRRARAVRALVINDVDDFERLAAEDRWDTVHSQAMLRALGCNPAAIDGVAGPLTMQATRWFQDEYNRGVHHPDGLDDPVEVSGDLDHATLHALHQSYVLSLSPQLTAEQLIDPRVIGCASFNRAGDGPSRLRTAELALWREGTAVPAAFPCEEGNPTACRIDDRGPRRCRFHRETFAGAEPASSALFYDFEWLPLPSGKINLSALTALPDGTPVRIRLHRDVMDYNGQVRQHHGRQPLPERGTLIGAEFAGIVRFGVCVALWSKPPEWDPFDWRLWFSELGDKEDTDEAPQPATFHPPLFSVQYEEGWAFSRPPGERIDRFILENNGRPGLALSNDAGIVQFSAHSERVVTTRERRTDQHIQILGWCSYLDKIRERGGNQ